MKERRNHRTALIIALVSIALTQTHSAILNPVLANIYAEFPAASDFLKSYIVTGASAVSIPFILLTGKLAEKYSKKRLLILGMVITLLGALGLATASSMELFAMACTVLYIGNSIANVLTFSLMFESFPAGNDSARVMGYYQTCMTLVMALCPTIAGFIAKYSWRAAMLIDMATIIPLACVILFVPNQKTAPTQEHGAAAQEPDMEAQENYRAVTDVPRIILTLVETAVVIIFGFVAVYYMSIYLDERGLGDSGVAGLVASAMTLVGVPFNLVFSKIYGKLHRYTGICFAILSSLAMIGLGANVPLAVVVVLGIFIGLGCAAKSSSYPILVNQYAATAKITTYQSVYNLVMYGASSVCGFVPNILARFTGGSMQKTFLYAGLILGGFSIAMLFVIRVYIEKKAANTQT